MLGGNVVHTARRCYRLGLTVKLTEVDRCTVVLKWYLPYGLEEAEVVTR